MTNWPVSQKIRGTGRPVERTVRLATGLILFSYATSHFINHAFGIRSVEAMQAAGLVLLKPWQTNPGRLLLYTALLVHAAIGLYAVYRRRHLRIPASEAWQALLARLTGKDPTLCPHCGRGHLRRVEDLEPVPQAGVRARSPP